jgi:DNA polymerase III delta subunit
VAGVQDLEELLKQAKAGGLRPLILVHGDEGYLVKQAYDRLLEAVVPEGLRDFNLEQHDGMRAQAQAILDSLATPPMLPGPKAVGVHEARYFASKSNVGELLGKARELWAGGDHSGALRQLGRVVVLAEWNWDEAAQAGPEGWAEALELGSAESEALKGPWLAEALAAAQAQNAPLSQGGDEAAELAEGLLAMLERWVEGTVLVCACSGFDARKKLSKLFIERGTVLSFRRAEKPAEVVQAARPFLRLALDQRKLKAPASLGERLLAAYGGDLGQLETEVEKLAAYAWPRSELTEADLAAVGSPRPEENVFKLFDALAAKKLGDALSLVRGFVAEDPDARYQLLGLVISEVRKLLLLRALMDEGRLSERGVSEATAFRMQVHPRVGRELPPALAQWWKRNNAWALFFALKRAKAFKAPQLHDLLRTLAQGDLAVKSGALRPEDLLEEACARLCGVREEAVL